MKSPKRYSLFFLLLVAALVREILTEKDDTKGYCSTYTGRICKAHIRSRQVWFSSSDVSGGWTNEQTTIQLFDEMILGLPEICRSAAEVRDVQSSAYVE